MQKKPVTVRAENEQEARQLGAKKLGADPDALDLESVGDNTYTVSIKSAPGRLEIAVSPDGMKAVVRSLVAPVGAGEPVTRHDADVAFDEAGVVFGIDPAAVERVVQAAQEQKPLPPDFEIARGREPESGKDGSVVFLFSTELTAGALDDDTGQIDFKERNALCNIKAGDLVAELTPAIPGKDGSDVRGRAIPARPGRDVVLSPAGNIRVSENGLQFFAEIDGTVSMAGPNAIAVLKHYVIKGDVDYSTGNLMMDGSLEIKGWIRSGFSVRASGDISVSEGVEDARVEAGGNLMVQGGIIGGGEHLVRAGRNVTARFLENARLKAGGAIEVKDTISRGNVSARGPVVVEGGKGGILGGTVFSSHSMVMNQLGSPGAARTTVIVGIDPKASNVVSNRKKALAFDRRRGSKARRSKAAAGRKTQRAGSRERKTTKIPVIEKLRRTTVLDEVKLEKFKERYAQAGTPDIRKLRTIVVKQRTYTGTRIVMEGHYLDIAEDIEKAGTFALDSQEGKIRFLI